MTTLELLTDVLGRNTEMLKGTFADFTDPEMLVRPVPGANHAAWQMGHLLTSEAGMVNAFAPGAVAGPAADFASKFTKETAKNDDPAFFPTKAQVVDALTKQRTATLAWAKSLSAADLDKPGPASMKSFAPTIGHLLSMMPVHDSMHMGQLQVIRRKLGKPVLF